MPVFMRVSGKGVGQKIAPFGQKIASGRTKNRKSVDKKSQVGDLLLFVQLFRM